MIKGIFPNEKILTRGRLHDDDSIDVLNFPTRVLNTLVMHDYETVGHFYRVSMADLGRIRNIGTKTLKYFGEVKAAIKEHRKEPDLPPLETAKSKEAKPSSFVPYLTETEKERMKLVKRLYDEYGTLEKVGSLLRLSRERVRQILNKGQKYGLFTYQLTRDRKFDEVLNKIDGERLRVLLSTTKNQFDVCSNLGIDISTLQRLIKYYNIDLVSYKQDARYKRYLVEYSEMVRVLGYHPSTTIMQRRKEWRKIWAGIVRLWGSFDRFRAEFGIEKPKHSMHPNTLKAWQRAKERRMAHKKEKVENVYKIIAEHGPLTCKKISYQYVKDMVKKNKIKKLGKGNRIKYGLNIQKNYIKQSKNYAH